jgi:hypothetical protein
MNEMRGIVLVWGIHHTDMVFRFPFDIESLFLCLPDEFHGFFGFVHGDIIEEWSLDARIPSVIMI